MAQLGLRVDDLDRRERFGALVLPIAIADVPVFRIVVGETVWLYDGPHGNETIRGSAVVSSLALHGDSSGRPVIGLADVHLLERTMLHAGSARGSGLDWKFFPEGLDGPDGLAEAAAVFERAPDLGLSADLYRATLKTYGWTCAATGQRFPAGPPLSDLTAEPLRPPERGGELHVRNFLALSAPAASALRNGMIGFNDDLGIIVDLDRCPAELSRRLRPRMHMPTDDSQLPDLAAVRWHRRHVLGYLS